MNTKFIFSVIFFLSFARFACSQNDILGEWAAKEPTDGITKVIISYDNYIWEAQVFGRCHPDDCDLGKTILLVFGNSINDKSIRYGLAHWDAGFKDTYMALRLEDGVLLAETYTHFKDKSGRSDYRMVDSFIKKK